MNEYDEILTCLSDFLSNENVKHEFYSIDSLDKRYEYFSKHSDKNFSKEKFKEIMNFLEEQTEKLKNGDLSEESLKNISGGADIPETDHRRIVKGLIEPGISYYLDIFDMGYSLRQIINLIKGKINYEYENEELAELQKKRKELEEEAEKVGLPKIQGISEIK